jgi:hypothetical protein
LHPLLGELLRISVTVEFSPPRRGNIRSSIGDPRLASEALSSVASVDPRSGLGRTLEWMKAMYRPGQAIEPQR